MSEILYSSKKLFGFEDNAVPPFIKECFIGLISQFEGFFKNGQVPDLPDDVILNINTLDPSIEPIYPFNSELKNDWITWIFLEVKTRLQMAIRYNNFLGEILSNDKNQDEKLLKKNIILFLRKFREIGSFNNNEDITSHLHHIGVVQTITKLEYDTFLRGEIERKFPSCSVLWIVNPDDTLSLSGYFTGSEDDQSLNYNSIPFIISPMHKYLDWREVVKYCIMASDAIILANTSNVGGIREEQEIIYAVNATNRTFVTNLENLEHSFSKFRPIDDLTEESIQTSNDANMSFLENLPGWGHWAGFESLDYARQYISALDKIWGHVVDSGKEVSPGYFTSLFTAMMALLIFRGELEGAASMAQTLAYTPMLKARGDLLEFSLSNADFHPQDLNTIDTLVMTSEWYFRNNELYRMITNLTALERGT